MKLLIITQRVNKDDQLLGFFIDWINEFAKHFSRVEILCLEKGGYSLPHNVTVTSLGKDRGRSKLAMLWNFYSFIIARRDKYDAVFVHMNPQYVVLGGLLWRLMGKKVSLWYASGGVTMMLRSAVAMADTVFTSTPEGLRINSPKTLVVGQGVDTDKFRLGSGAPANSIISVGRLAPVKNYEALISAVGILRDKGQEFSLDIIGEPALEKDKVYLVKLQSLVHDLRLDSQVRFLGKISHQQLPALYQSHHFYVNLSKTGSLDKTIIEAILCGCITLSSNDAVKKILPSELIILDEDPGKLAERILALRNFEMTGVSAQVARDHSLRGLIDRISSDINKNNSVIVAGYPYIRESYFKTFQNYEGTLYFLLPRRWQIKKGKIIYKAPKQPNVIKTATFFSHSDYPLIGGMMKGWMPSLPIRLSRFPAGSIFYNASEPVLLSTLYHALSAKLCGMKVVLFSWENVPYSQKLYGLPGAIQRIILKANLFLMDGLVCGNNKCLETFQSLTNKQLAQIPLSGVDTGFFQPADQVKDSAGPNYIFTGSISYRKGLNELAAAFKEVVSHLPAAKLKIVGSGEYEGELSSKIKELGLTSSVQLIPWAGREELRELLRNGDIFVYPSISHGGWQEQFGYSMAEASACGLPVIATRSGSIEEVVKDGQTGLLVPEKDSAALAQTMISLGRDGELAKKMGQSGRNYIEDNFSYQAIAKKYYNFFQTL